MWWSRKYRSSCRRELPQISRPGASFQTGKYTTNSSEKMKKTIKGSKTDLFVEKQMW